MKISIIHPSRGRADMAYKTFYKWRENAFFLGHEYILSLDTDDNIDAYLNLFSNVEVAIMANHNRSAIEAINKAAETASGDLFIVISDDFDCNPYWDSQLLEALVGRKDFLVKTQDGIQKTLITLPIMDRIYYERFGYVYFPGYSHMWSDTEMTAVGHLLGKVVNLDLCFPHNHYTVGGMKKDAINVKNDNTWMQGELLFKERLKSNFGIENPVIKYSDIQWR